MFVIKRRVMNDKRLIELGNIETINQVIDNQLSLNGSQAIIYREIANLLLNSGQPEIAQDYFKLSLKKSLTPSTYSLYLQ